MQSELMAQMVMSLVRKGLVALGVYLGTKSGISDEALWNDAVSAVLVLGGAGWSLWIKYQEARRGRA